MNKPTFINQEWFDKNFYHNLSLRGFTQKIALNLLNQLHTNPLIVETGTVRMENDWGAGMSTLLFGNYVANHGGRVVTVDCNHENMKVCKQVTKPFEQYITYVVEDSLKYLATLEDKIDLLYLDSMDTPIEGDCSESAQHNLNEFLIAERLLNPMAIIMIDDVGMANEGKGGKTHEYLAARGYLLITKFQQSVWLKVQ